RRAQREFGGLERVKEEVRDTRWETHFDNLVRDFRYAFRNLRKDRRFSLVAIFALALGIGATTAVFSVVDRVLFRGLPYAHDDRLVSFGLTAPIEKDEFMLGASYVDFRRAPGLFEEVTSMLPGDSKCDLTEQSAVRLSCARVEQTFLSTLGVQLILGRNFTPEEDRPNGPRVAILSYEIGRASCRERGEVAGGGVGGEDIERR